MNLFFNYQMQIMNKKKYEFEIKFDKIIHIILMA